MSGTVFLAWYTSSTHILSRAFVLECVEFDDLIRMLRVRTTNLWRRMKIDLEWHKLMVVGTVSFYHFIGLDFLFCEMCTGVFLFLSWVPKLEMDRINYVLTTGPDLCTGPRFENKITKHWMHAFSSFKEINLYSWMISQNCVLKVGTNFDFCASLQDENKNIENLKNFIFDFFVYYIYIYIFFFVDVETLLQF